MSELAVRAKYLRKQFGKQVVLDSVSIDFEAGRIHGLIGRNGSGKTVLMKCILGFLRPDGGSVQVFGKTIGKDCDFAPDTGMMIETPGFLWEETGKTNLLWMSKIRGKGDKRRVEEVMELVGLNPGLRTPVGKYSLGMRQRLGIAQAILDGPGLLILDEPMNGLDKQGVADIRRLLLEWKKEGVTIILTSHYAEDIHAVCDSVCEMDCGILTRHTPL